MKRKVQVALDTDDLPAALAALQRVSEFVDIIEVGTVLCLAEGIRAVSAIRAAYPGHVLLADVRIAEAGALLSRLAFSAGADWVTVVSGAAPATFGAVADVAREFGGSVQVELSDGWGWPLLHNCRRLGIEHFVFHRSRDAETSGESSWSTKDLNAIAEVHRLGGRVSVTGGLKQTDVAGFAGSPVEIFIAGRALYDASDPAHSAREFAAAVHGLPGVPAYGA